MIWRLEYENAHGDVARLDIQRGLASTHVEIIEGTENPFLLSYELEGKNKKGFIMSSFADISVYETPTFNIDDLKTSNETELSVKWYINSVLEWTGFVVPDFFSREIGEPAIVNLAASDRLSALKGATLEGLSEYITLRDLAIACLAKTGLSLPLTSTVDFKVNTTNVMDVFALSDRLEDDKGKKISCFDVLRSILVLTNSTIRQRNGRWTLINKIQHEAVNPRLTFNEVYAGAKRTIHPVFSSVGALHEFGGLKSSPANNSFNAGVTGWTRVNGFKVEFDTREVSYSEGSPVIIFGDETDDNKLINRNVIISQQSFYHAPRLVSSDIRIPFANGEANFAVIISSRGSGLLRGIFYIEKKHVGKPSQFTSDGKQWSNYPREIHSRYKVTTPFSDSIIELNCTLPLEEGENPSEISIVVHIGELWALTYDAGEEPIGTGIAINSVRVISKTGNDAKGMLYRTEQIGVFSKKNDPETTIFGDYISNGLNGYFYPYSEDDNSILRIQANDDYLTSRWTTATDPFSGELPILQHVARQNSRMFGVAHNILSAVIDANTFDPLSNVSNCAGEKYVVVAATFDFLRSTVEVELQQIAYGTLERRDFIYSYFGGEDDGIRSIGSVSGGNASIGVGGGGSFLDKYFSFDEANNALIANVNLVSEKELAAYFGGGGGDLPSIDLPVATATTLGGVKVSPGSGLVMNGEQLEIDGDTFNLANYYTKTNLQTSGQAQVHWSNLTSKPTTLSGYGITDAVTGTGTAGQISYWNGTGSQAGSPNFRFDSENNNVEIGKTNSNSNLTIYGTRAEPSTSGSALNGLFRLGNLETTLVLDMGINIVGSVYTWLQSRNRNNNATNYTLSLNPNGGGVAIGKTKVTSGYTLDVNGAIRAEGNLYATGSIYATGNITGAGEVTAYTASDARLKDNITSLSTINALDIINALNPVTYTWNSKAVQLNPNKNTTSINYGLIAQELEQIAPDLIRPIYGDYKTYDDRGLMTIMLQAIKELKSKVDKLENKN